MVGVSEVSAGVGGRNKRFDIIDLSERCMLYQCGTISHYLYRSKSNHITTILFADMK